MATIAELIERVEQRLFLLPGLDVQIHAEGQLEEMLRSTYNELFDDFWFIEHMKFMTSQLNGTSGEIVDNISQDVLRYKDIHSVYYDEHDDPLPMITAAIAPSRIRTRSIMPSGKPESVFKMYPVTETGPLHFWYRTKIADSVWKDQKYDTPVNMDDEILLHGTMVTYLTLDDSNKEATDLYKGKFALRKRQLESQQLLQPINKRSLERDGPATRWS